MTNPEKQNDKILTTEWWLDKKSDQTWLEKSNWYKNSNTIKDLFDDFSHAIWIVKDFKRQDLITEILRIKFGNIEEYNIHFNYNDEFPVFVDENGNFYVEEPEYKTLFPTTVTNNWKNEIIFKTQMWGKIWKKDNPQSSRLYLVAPKRKKWWAYAWSEERRQFLTQWLENAEKDPKTTQADIDELKSLIEIAMDSTGDA